MKLGEKIKQLRVEAELTQPELANKAKIEQSYLSKLENEKGSPSFEVITKVAQALDQDALKLIESLDHLYIKEKLSHIPEIAEKHTELRMVKQFKTKQRYVIASLMIILGVALTFLGGSKALFPDTLYEYVSLGIIKPGETTQQFKSSPIRILGEEISEFKQRMSANRSRIDESIKHSKNYLGENYIEYVSPVDRRVYELDNTSEHHNRFNDVLIVFGLIFMVSGGFTMNYVYKFKD